MASGSGLKILAWASVLLLFVIAAYISRPLIGTVMFGILLTYMLYPIYKLALSKTKSERLSSLIAVSTVLMAAALIVLIAYLTVLWGLAGVSSDLSVAQNINATNFNTTNFNATNLWDKLGVSPKLNHSLEANRSLEINQSLGIDRLSGINKSLGINDSLGINQPQGIHKLTTMIQEGMVYLITSFILPTIVQEAVDVWIRPILESGVFNFLLAIPIFLAQLIGATFLAYYLILNGRGAAIRLPDLLPKHHRIVGRYYLNELNGAFKSLFTVNFDIAAYNALMGIIIFSLIGVPLGAIWAVMAAVLSLVRFFGPWLVFVPLSASLLLANDFSKGFFVLLFGFALLEYVPEHILRPRISEGSYRVNTAFAFLSYVAPVLVLGPLGIILGPFVYGLLIAAYRTALEFSEKGPIAGGEPQLPVELDPVK